MPFFCEALESEHALLECLAAGLAALALKNQNFTVKAATIVERSTL